MVVLDQRGKYFKQSLGDFVKASVNGDHVAPHVGIGALFFKRHGVESQVCLPRLQIVAPLRICGRTMASI